MVLHSGKRIVPSPILLAKQDDSLIDTRRERHITFNRNLYGLVLDEILKTDIQLGEYLHLTALMFQDLPPFLEKKHAIIKVKNTYNRCFGDSLLSALHPRAKDPLRPFRYQRFA